MRGGKSPYPVCPRPVRWKRIRGRNTSRFQDAEGSNEGDRQNLKSQQVENVIAISPAPRELPDTTPRRLARRNVRTPLRRNYRGRIPPVKARPDRKRDRRARATSLV